MKGNAKVIAALNEGLCGELSAINQFFIHSKMCENWGYAKLAKKSYEESIEEMKHAEEIMNRILFLDGVPNMQKYKKIVVGTTVQEQLQKDLKIELEQVKTFKKGISIANAADDHVSRDLMEVLLKDEEGHVDYLEAQRHLIGEIGIQNYLAQQL